jgi:hypothetical protein
VPAEWKRPDRIVDVLAVFLSVLVVLLAMGDVTGGLWCLLFTLPWLCYRYGPKLAAKCKEWSQRQPQAGPVIQKQTRILTANTSDLVGNLLAEDQHDSDKQTKVFTRVRFQMLSLAARVLAVRSFARLHRTVWRLCVQQSASFAFATQFQALSSTCVIRTIRWRLPVRSPRLCASTSRSGGKKQNT